MSTSALSINLRSYDKEIKEFLGAVLIGALVVLNIEYIGKKVLNIEMKMYIIYVCLKI